MSRPNGYKFACCNDGEDLTDIVIKAILTRGAVPPALTFETGALRDRDGITQVLHHAPESTPAVLAVAPMQLRGGGAANVEALARTIIEAKRNHPRKTSPEQEWGVCVTCPRDHQQNLFYSSVTYSQREGETIAGFPTPVSNGFVCWHDGVDLTPLVGAQVTSSSSFIVLSVKESPSKSKIRKLL